jgi:hypothetical protein
MSEFTPGPWRAISWEEKAIRIVPDAYIGPVGEVFGHKGQPMQANANLIAAAPELYEACEEALATFEEMQTDKCSSMLLDGMIVKLWAAIKKARGE